MSRARRITGHLVVEERKDGPRVWVAKYMRTEGTPTRKVLGPAWAKPARTASDRGAPASKRWRSADGPKPAGHLTPREAQERLDEILSAERAKHGAAVRMDRRDHTFGEAVTAYLWHVEHVKRSRRQRSITTGRSFARGFWSPSMSMCRWLACRRRASRDTATNCSPRMRYRTRRCGRS